MTEEEQAAVRITLEEARKEYDARKHEYEKACAQCEDISKYHKGLTSRKEVCRNMEVISKSIDNKIKAKSELETAEAKLKALLEELRFTPTDNDD